MKRQVSFAAVGALVLAVLSTFTAPGRVLAQNVACYIDQGGAGWHLGSGCTLTVELSGILNVASGGAFQIGGTSVTATAANLNAIPTATGTGAVIDALTKGYCSNPTVVLSASAAVQTATITCKDADGTTLAVPTFLTVYVADDSAGATVSTVAVNGAVSFTTGSLAKLDTSKLLYRVVTNASGVAVLSLDNTGGADHYAHYVAVVIPGGKLKVSLVTDTRSS